ncbi:MAG: site-specific integrase, partial [Bacteroidales bacterium]|nr:site-specific integrase [Bacteroidales bacterium]
MIDSYLQYLATIRRYSSRTVEIYRGVLEEYLAFLAETTGAAETAVGSADRGHPRPRKREGPAAEGCGRGPAQPDVCG